MLFFHTCTCMRHSVSLPNFIGSTEHPQEPGLEGGSSGGGSAGSRGGWLKRCGR